MIEKMLVEIIKLEHKAHQVHKDHQVQQVHKVTPERQVLKEYKVYKDLLVLMEHKAYKALTNQINSTSIYSVVGNFSSTSPDGFALSIAMCNLGDSVLSGSYILSNADDATSVSDFALATQDGWASLATGTVFAAVQTIAQCFNNP